MNNRLINTKVAGSGGCTDIVDNYDPFGGNGVALYQLNGNATDVSGNYNGTATSVTYGAGQFGQAGVFNGSSSYIVIPSSVSPSTDLSSFNYSFWVSIDSSFTDSKWIIGESTATGPTRVGIYNVSGNLYSFDFLRRYGGTYYGFAQSSSFELIPGTFYHFSVNWNPSPKSWQLYFNGNFIYSTSTVTYSGSQTAVSTLAIGRYNSVTPTSYWNGKIDQVRIFNKALSAGEVTTLYNETPCN